MGEEDIEDFKAKLKRAEQHKLDRKQLTELNELSKRKVEMLEESRKVEDRLRTLIDLRDLSNRAKEARAEFDTVQMLLEALERKHCEVRDSVAALERSQREVHDSVTAL